MKNIRFINYFILLFGFTLITQNSAIAQGRHPSKSEIKENIETFTNVSLYAVSYSEPLSLLLSAPEINKLGLHTWLNIKKQEVSIDILDATTKEELDRLRNKEDRLHAVYTCIYSKDCSRLRDIEDNDRLKQVEFGNLDSQDFSHKSGSAEAAWKGSWTVKSEHKSGRFKGAKKRSSLIIKFNNGEPEVIFANVKTMVIEITPTTLIYAVDAGGNYVTTTLNRVGNGIKGTFSGYNKSAKLRKDPNFEIGGIYESVPSL